MSTLLKALGSPLLTRLGILAVLVLSFVLVSVSQSRSATAACGECWWSIGANAWTCQGNNQIKCTLSVDQFGNSRCVSGGACSGGGIGPEEPENP